jgi:hypothetical protein
MNTFSMKIIAIFSAVIVLVQGVMIAPFVSPWSMITKMESHPSFIGRSVIKSTDNCVNGLFVVETIGFIGGMVGCVLILYHWHPHPSTYFLM